MNFLQPTYLWGLLFILVPLVIHLLNKGDVKTIKVGSVRYLTEQETKQTRQIRLNELLLLFLRMLLLAFLVLATTEPVLPSKNKNVALTYLVEPSLINSGQMDTFLKEAPGVPIRLFANNFPALDSENLPQEVPDYWQLAQELPNLESDSIVVFSKARMTGIRGKRPVIPATVFWIVMDEVEVTDSLIGATATIDGAVVHTIKSDASYTDIENTFISKNQIAYSSEDSIITEQNEISKTIPIYPKDTLRIGISYDVEFLKEKLFFTAAFEAIAEYSQRHLVLEEVTGANPLGKTTFHLRVWLKRDIPPKIEGKLIRYQADTLATKIIEKASEKDLFYLTQRLTIDRVLRERLTEDLLQIVITAPALEAAISSLDKRTLPAQEFTPAVKDIVSMDAKKQQRSMANWFWIAALLVLVLERLLAKFRKQ